MHGAGQAAHSGRVLPAGAQPEACTSGIRLGGPQACSGQSAPGAGTPPGALTLPAQTFLAYMQSPKHGFHELLVVMYVSQPSPTKL